MPTQTLSLQTLIESALANPILKFASGNVSSLERLLEADVCEALDRMHHAGAFALLACTAEDVHVQAYLKLGSLAADAGRKLLVLMVATDEPAPVTEAVAGLSVNMGTAAVYEFARSACGASHPIQLPGVVLFHRLSEPCEPVFVTLQDSESSDKVRQRLLAVTAQVGKALVNYHAGKGSFAEHLTASLLTANVPYVRSGKRSLREWLIGGYRTLRANAKDIVAVVKSFK